MTFEFKTTFSPCGKYRYGLYRKLSEPVRPLSTYRKFMISCLLNPSIAGRSTAEGDEINDPTAMRVMGYAIRERCTDLYMINPMAKVVTDSKKLKDHPDREGPENFAHIKSLLEYLAWQPAHTYVFLCGWGAAKFTSIFALRLLLSQYGKERGLKYYCLGRNEDGSPKHPLYLRADAPLQEYKP